MAKGSHCGLGKPGQALLPGSSPPAVPQMCWCPQGLLNLVLFWSFKVFSWIIFFFPLNIYPSPAASTVLSFRPGTGETLPGKRSPWADQHQAPAFARPLSISMIYMVLHRGETSDITGELGWINSATLGVEICYLLPPPASHRLSGTPIPPAVPLQPRNIHLLSQSVRPRQG